MPIVAAAQKICATLSAPAVVAYTHKGTTALRMLMMLPMGIG